jgi:Uma2 family endonuclease
MAEILVADRATAVEELGRVPENGKAEIVGGKVVLMSPSGLRHNFAGGEIFASLRQYAKQTKSGYAVTDNGGFLVDLPNRQSFSPDAAFYTGPFPDDLSFGEGAPVFAAEVRSKEDYGPNAETAIAEKRREYFAAGTKVVWDVDLKSNETVRSYRADAPESPVIYRRGDLAAAEPAVPGWQMPVDDLFAN